MRRTIQNITVRSIPSSRGRRSWRAVAAVLVGSIVAPSVVSAASVVPADDFGLVPEYRVDSVVPVEPYRLADTRVDRSRLDAGEVRFVPVVGRGGVTPEATAVNVNVTAVAPSASGHFRVWPCASETDRLPTASMVNFAVREDRANAGVVGIGPTGGLCVYSLVEADLIVDVMGYSTGESGVTPVVPFRVFDSRSAGAALPAGRVERIQFSGRGGVPTGAASVYAVVTTTGATAGGFITVWPCASASEQPPLASVANYRPGVDVASNALIALAADGAACVFTHASTHVIVDVTASVTVDSPIRAIVPERILDTRNLNSDDLLTWSFLQCGRLVGQPGCLATNDPVSLYIGTLGAVKVAERSTVPGGAIAALVTVTVVASPSSYGFATVWPAGIDMPTASVVNYRPGETVPNTVLVGLDQGSFQLYLHSSTDVVVDVVGYVYPPDALLEDWPWQLDFSPISDVSGSFVYEVALCEPDEPAGGPAFSGPTGAPLTADALVNALNGSEVLRERVRLAFLDTIDISFATSIDGQCGWASTTPGRRRLDQLSSPSTEPWAGRGSMAGSWIGMYFSPFDGSGALTEGWIAVFLHEFGHNLGFDHANFDDDEYASGLDFMGALWEVDRLHVQRLVGVGAVDEENVRLHTSGTTTLALTGLPAQTGEMTGPSDILAVAVPSTGDGSHPMYESGAVMMIEPVVSSIDGACIDRLAACDGIVVNFAHGHAYHKVVLDPTHSFGSTPYGYHDGTFYPTGAAVLQLGDSVTIGGVTITAKRRDADNRIVATVSGAFDEAVPVGGVVLNPSVVTVQSAGATRTRHDPHTLSGLHSDIRLACGTHMVTAAPGIAAT